MAIDLELSRRAHAMFMQVMDLEPDQRRAHVLETCRHDPALLTQVMGLVDAADRATSFLEDSSPVPLASQTASMPATIGRYRVTGILGTGGMATVYEALQEDPHRRVALKVLHQRMTRPDVLARFRFETEALARLHHPAIAQIYEAGVASLDSGGTCQFFAMELVPEGLPVTDFVVRSGMKLAQRLELFAIVCDALQHGHQHGVIHRDIKPANVLVSSDGRPKVIDFGIARATEPRADSPTAAVGFHQLIGTLHAMSPEQCTSPGDVDIRTDVYSLGVLLYEMIAGRRPHDLGRCSIPDAVRMITEVEPQPVSRLVPAAAGDLDAILAKAMDKDRERRYPTAAAFAADIRRYLADQPIDARPTSRLEQLRKFVRRNRALSFASLTAILLMVAGTILSVRLAYLENRARKASEQRQRQLEMVTEFQESLLRDIDVADLGDRLKKVLLENVKRSFAADEPESSADAVRGALDRVNFTSLALRMLQDSLLRRYQESIASKFGQEPIVQARLLQELARTMNTLGLNAEAEPALREALRIRELRLGPDHADTLLSTHALGSLLSTLGREDEAVELLRKSYERQSQTLGPDHVATMRTGMTFGGALRRQGNLKEAERIWRRTLEDQRRVLGPDDPQTLKSLNNMGVVHATLGRFNDAEACWRELLERRQRVLGEDHPDTRSVLGNLCGLLQEQGKLDEASALRPQIERALAAERRRLGDLHPTTLLTMGQLASLLHEVGDLVKAENLQRECMEGRSAALGKEHPSTLIARTSLADILSTEGNSAAAEELVRETLAIQRRVLGDTHPDTLLGMDRHSQLLKDVDRLEEALALNTEALEHARRSPTVPAWVIGQVLSNRGMILLSAGRPSEAVTSLEEAYPMLQAALGTEHPKCRTAARRLDEARKATRD